MFCQRVEYSRDFAAHCRFRISPGIADSQGHLIDTAFENGTWSRLKCRWQTRSSKPKFNLKRDLV
jgi:hypothetical protein